MLPALAISYAFSGQPNVNLLLDLTQCTEDEPEQPSVPQLLDLTQCTEDEPEQPSVPQLVDLTQCTEDEPAHPNVNQLVDLTQRTEDAEHSWEPPVIVHTDMESAVNEKLIGQLRQAITSRVYAEADVLKLRKDVDKKVRGLINHWLFAIA
jgi:hypothetical protein